MLIRFYKDQMTKFGESYASGLYILASLILALSGTGLHKIYDSVAGGFYFFCDVTILILQFMNKAPKLRTFLLFGGSLIGSFILFAGGIFDDLQNAITPLEWSGAIVRFISNSILVFASFVGVITLFPKTRLPIPEKPGGLYMLSYAFFFAFSIIQMVYIPSIMSFGYILATILWALAANAIRLKYDERN